MTKELFTNHLKEQLIFVKRKLQPETKTSEPYMVSVIGLTLGGSIATTTFLGEEGGAEGGGVGGGAGGVGGGGGGDGEDAGSGRGSPGPEDVVPERCTEKLVDLVFVLATKVVSNLAEQPASQ